MAMSAAPSGAIAKGSSFAVLYTFTGGNDGGVPETGLIADGAGNLYGTTFAGCGYGTVFKLAPDGTETVLHCFNSGNDGGGPLGALIQDQAGNLYGTTYEGGADNSGTVFTISASGTESVLYTFTGGADGSGPLASLIRDKQGNLYGTTGYGGASGNGAVFKLAPDGTETVLYSFTGGNDGGLPYGSLIRDKGDLYGTTLFGGAYGAGTVFKVAANGTETVLYAFTGGTDGGFPGAGLIKDKAGNFYGTTSGGGIGAGTVFKLAPDGTETVLYTFTGANDGGYPLDGLLADKNGNLYGTASGGGTDNSGAVFKVTPGGTESVLYSFTNGNDGSFPIGGLVKDSGNTSGDLFGTAASAGADGNGTVFKLKK